MRMEYLALGPELIIPWAWDVRLQAENPSIATDPQLEFSS